MAKWRDTLLHDIKKFGDKPLEVDDDTGSLHPMGERPFGATVWDVDEGDDADADQGGGS